MSAAAQMQMVMEQRQAESEAIMVKMNEEQLIQKKKQEQQA